MQWSRTPFPSPPRQANGFLCTDASRSDYKKILGIELVCMHAVCVYELISKHMKSVRTGKIIFVLEVGIFEIKI